MAERWIEVRIENGREAHEWLRMEFSTRSARLKGFIEQLADIAMAWMHVYGPRGDTGYLQAHIHKGPLHWHPGGFGGGGSWEIEVGVLRGTSEHPLYVHEGTGIWGPQRRRISPRMDRAKASVFATGLPRARWQTVPTDPVTGKPDTQRMPALTFQKRGEPRKFRLWVSGQRPQPFVRLAFQQTQIYTLQHLHSMDVRVR